MATLLAKGYSPAGSCCKLRFQVKNYKGLRVFCPGKCCCCTKNGTLVSQEKQHHEQHYHSKINQGFKTGYDIQA